MTGRLDYDLRLPLQELVQRPHGLRLAGPTTRDVAHERADEDDLVGMAIAHDADGSATYGAEPDEPRADGRRGAQPTAGSTLVARTRR